MTNFAINYAYNGFLYAPLILAKELNLLPSNAVLKHRDGDLQTINSLKQWEEEGFENWFAICDPFARNLSGYAPPASSESDPVCIVGAFVGRLPVWLYNTDPKFGRCASEEQLRSEASGIRRILCYERPNTGYLIGKHVCDLFPSDKVTLLEVDFGKELIDLEQNDIAVTSDVLAVSRSFRARNNNVVFSLFSGCERLDPFLFTAILTLKSVVDKELPTVLSVLAGLRTAARQFESSNVSDEGVNILATKFASQMPETYTSQERRNAVQDAIRLLSAAKIYSGDLDIDTAERGYNIARTEWHTSLKREFDPVEKQKDPIPSLLIKEDWRNHSALARAFAESWRPEHSAGYESPVDMSAVIAVADAWRNNEHAITAVTRNWLSNSKSEAIIKGLLPGLEATTPATSAVEEYKPPVKLVALLNGALLIVLTAASFFSQRLGSAVQALAAIASLMVGGLFVVSYWKPRERNGSIWWAAAFSYLLQMGCAFSICRDVFGETKDEWGHHEGLWSAIVAVLFFLAGIPILETVFKRLMDEIRKLQTTLNGKQPS